MKKILYFIDTLYEVFKEIKKKMKPIHYVWFTLWLIGGIFGIIFIVGMILYAINRNPFLTEMNPLLFWIGVGFAMISYCIQTYYTGITI